MSDINISLRPVRDEDKEFLCEVYCSTRRDEVATFGWDAAQADAFLRMQFTMQQGAYNVQSPNAEYSVILLSETPSGRMIVNRTSSAMTLIDVTVLPQFRGIGIGTYLIKRLQDEAAASEKPLILHVDKGNQSAMKLYEKLGFRVKSEAALAYEMEWRKR